MSNTISIGKVFFDLYIDYFFETSGTASCGTTGIIHYIDVSCMVVLLYVFGSRCKEVSDRRVVVVTCLMVAFHW